MQMDQHDSSNMFRIVLIGELGESGARELRWAWETAKSILRGKELSVDVSAVTKADLNAIHLLACMRESGARITAALTATRARSERLLTTKAGGSARCGALSTAS